MIARAYIDTPDIKHKEQDRSCVAVSYYRDPVNITIYQNGGATGWTEYRNEVLGSEVQGVVQFLDLPQGVWVNLPLRDDGGVQDEKVAETIAIDNNTNGIVSTRTNDYYTGVFDMLIKSDIAENKGKFRFFRPDIDVEFRNSKFTTNEDATVVGDVDVTNAFYTGWKSPEQAFAQIKMVSGDARLYGLGCQFGLIHKSDA